MARCPGCGVRAPESESGARYCPACGGLLPPAPVSPPADRRPRRRWWRRTTALAALAVAGTFAAAVLFDGAGTDSDPTPVEPAVSASGGHRSFAGPLPVDGAVAWRVDLQPLRPPIDPSEFWAEVVPTHDGVTVVSVRHAGLVLGLETATGRRLWTRYGAVSGIHAAGDAVVLAHDGAEDRALVVVGARRGEPRWTLSAPPGWVVAASPETLVLAADDEVIVLDSADGTERWRVDVVPHPGQIVVGSGTVLVWNWYLERLAAYDEEDGHLLWEEDLVTTWIESVREHDGHVVVTWHQEDQGRVHLTVFDTRTGASLWEMSDGSVGTAVVAGGRVVVRNPDGLTAHAIADGTEAWRRDRDRDAWHRPDALDPDALYVHHGAEITMVDPVSGRDAWIADDPLLAEGELREIAAGHAIVWTPPYVAAVALPDAREVWRHDVRPWLVCTPIPASGGELVYVSRGGGLLAVDAGTGAPLWEYGPFDRDDTQVDSVGVGEDLIALLAQTPGAPPQPSLHVADARDGLHVSTIELRGRLVGPPLVTGPDVVVAGGFTQFNLARVHARSGRSWWERQLPGRVLGAPALADGTVVVPTTSGVVAVDLETGAGIWSAPIANLSPTPALVAGQLAVVVAMDELVALDLRTGRRRWAHEGLDRLEGRIAVGEGAVYLATTDLVALDARSGREMWRRGFEAHPLAAPAVVGDEVVVLTHPGRFHVLDARTGKDVRTLDVGELVHGPFVVTDGRIHACTPDGHLVTIGASAGAGGG